MYYGEQDDPYQNYDLNHYIKNNLPMDEFRTGNFSQAHKIKEVFREQIKSCIKSHTYSLTEGEGNISTYLQKQLAKLEEEHKERSGKKEQAVKEIRDIEQKIRDEKQALKDEGKGDKTWNIFFDFLEKVSNKKNTFDIYDLGILEQAFERTETEKPEKYKETKDVFEKFVASTTTHIEKFGELESALSKSKRNRSDATEKLSHKSNRSNLEKQIKGIKSGQERSEMEGYIKKQIERTFRKINHMDDVLDSRSLEGMFTSMLTTQLIIDAKTEKKLKQDLIRNHTDKVGLFVHIWKLYRKEDLFWLDIYTGRSDHSPKPIHQLREDSITGLVKTAKEILSKMPDISYFRTTSMSKEQRQQYDTIGHKNWKNHVMEDLTTHLEKTLQKSEKEGARRKEPDKKLEKLFDGIYSIMENHEFENFCEQLRNLDEGKYRGMLGAEGKAILKQIYFSMNQEEREITKGEQDTRGSFKEIEQEVSRQEKEEEEKQLLLFDLPEMYSLKGYPEQVTKNIQSLIEGTSYRHERLFENAVWRMFADKGIKKYVDASEPLPTLSDEEFLEIIKNSRNGKAISLKLKKVSARILPDINNRINEMKKKKEKEDKGMRRYYQRAREANLRANLKKMNSESQDKFQKI